MTSGRKLRTQAVTFALVLALAGTGMVFALPRWTDTSRPLTTTRAGSAFLIAVIALSLLLLGKPNSLVRDLREAFNFPAFAVVSLALAGSLWSINTSASLLENLRLLSGLFAAFALHRTWDHSTIRRLVLLALSASFAISLALHVMNPALLIRNGTIWAGLYNSSSTAGLLSALGVLLSLLERKLSLFIRASGGLLSLGVLFLSGSRTAQLALLVALFCAPLLQFARSPRTTAFVLGTLLPFATVMAVLSAGYLGAAAGKNASLSGRTGVWSGSWNMFLDRPLLGWGPAAPWSVFSLGYDFGFGGDLVPQGAHSLILEFAVGLGLPGAVAICLFFGRVGRRAWFERNAAVAAFSLFILVASVTNVYVFKSSLASALLWLAVFKPKHRGMNYERQRSDSATTDRASSFRNRADPLIEPLPRPVFEVARNGAGSSSFQR